MTYQEAYDILNVHGQTSDTLPSYEQFVAALEVACQCLMEAIAEEDDRK